MKSALPMAVVVPNWNLAADTSECVRSLLAAGAGLAVQVIVVDNGSTDGSPARLAGEFERSIELIELPSNRGFAAAVNTGVQHALAAGAASVLVLNNDTIVAPDMLSLLCAAAPAADIVGPAIYYHDAPARLWRLGDRASRWLPVPRRVPERPAGERTVPVDYLTGCAMLVGREVFETIGLFDESYFMYYEDADFCRRARDRGFTLLAVPPARMWHKVSLTARADPRATVTGAPGRTFCSTAGIRAAWRAPLSIRICWSRRS